MIDKSLFEKIKRIHIRSNKLVNTIVAGEYESAFRGRGMEFQQVREYVPGDDIRLIDWNVTARTGGAFIKEFKEERELNIMVAVDLSGSSIFGSSKEMKRDVAAELAALFSCLAVKSNDRVGMLLFTDKIEKFLPPKKGRSNIWRVIKEVLSFEPSGTGTDIAMALNFLSKALPRRAVCFIISDFFSFGYEKALKLINNKHETVAVSVMDRREYELPSVGYAELQDAETGETMLVNTSNEKIRKIFRIRSQKRLEIMHKFFISNNIDHIDIWTDAPYIYPVLRYFKMKEKKH
ncbi:MAG: DUF58 domain-containing protein [Candidatus Schekmanbacteria bacterium]|nr:DUF58 domain-containing protein [Candidatus Schekmanbacteria bacterium]